MSERPRVEDAIESLRAAEATLGALREQCRLFLVEKPFRLFVGDYRMAPKIVLAHNAPEARHVVREHLYARGHEVPGTLIATEIDMASARILDVHDEEARAELSRESEP